VTPRRIGIAPAPRREPVLGAGAPAAVGTLDA
jgi:hypothetical protein